VGAVLSLDMAALPVTLLGPLLGQPATATPAPSPWMDTHAERDEDEEDGGAPADAEGDDGTVALGLGIDDEDDGTVQDREDGGAAADGDGDGDDGEGAPADLSDDRLDVGAATPTLAPPALSRVPDLAMALREALADALPFSPHAGAWPSSTPQTPPAGAGAGGGSFLLSPPTQSALRLPAGLSPEPEALATVRRRLASPVRRASARTDPSIIDALWCQGAAARAAQAAFLAEAEHMRRWLASTVAVRVHPVFQREAAIVHGSLYVPTHAVM
jgi:hypothetical protein